MALIFYQKYDGRTDGRTNKKLVILSVILWTTYVVNLRTLKGGCNSKILDSIHSSNDDTSKASVKPSQVSGKDWSIAITRLVFKPGMNTTNKLASVYLTISNNNGADKAFLPTGKIVGYVGASGKSYPVYDPNTLDEDYKNAQDFLKEKAQKYGTVYQPGTFTTMPEVLIDSNEKGFSKIIYQDGNGKKTEIPIQEVTPEILSPNPDAK